MLVGNKHNILIKEFHLLHFWGRRAAGVHNAVRTEIVIGRAVAEVAAVGKRFTVFRLLYDRLVDIVPNEPALVLRIILL